MTIAKKVETAPMAKVAIVDSLIEEDVEHLSPEQLDDILAHFASMVASCSESEVMTKSRLHELLHQAVSDVEQDSFSDGG